VPSGQFGTRIQGGKDAASPCYISTKIAPITRSIFPEADDAVLNYQEEDGLGIEPSHYMPVLPMVLVNGADGIGTGWSSSVPNYDPIDVIANLRRVIAGEEQETGKSDKGAFAVRGVYEVTNDTTVEITELPVGMWAQKYKEILETLLEGNTKKDDGKSSQFSVKHNVTIKHFTENHTDTAVSFTLTFSAEKFAEAEKVGIMKVFKLESSISVANMHLFDAECRIKKYTGPQESLTWGIKITGEGNYL